MTDTADWVAQFTDAADVLDRAAVIAERGVAGEAAIRVAMGERVDRDVWAWALSSALAYGDDLWFDGDEPGGMRAGAHRLRERVEKGIPVVTDTADPIPPVVLLRAVTSSGILHAGRRGWRFTLCGRRTRGWSEVGMVTADDRPSCAVCARDVKAMRDRHPADQHQED